MPVFLFAGGGTGGHIYPALAIADHLTALDPAADCRFLISTRPLDAEILAGERLAGRPVRFTPIPAQPFALRPRSFARFVSSWGKAVRASRVAIREARADGAAHVIAMGGFVAAPAAQAARAEKRPVTLVNLDATPGRANRWIAKRAQSVFTAAPVPGVRWTVVPPIVRADALAPGPPAECRRVLGLDPDRPTLLVTGASQGARSINDFAAAFARAHADTLRRGRWQVLHQCGKVDPAPIEQAYADAHLPARVTPFIRAMGAAWGAADLAVSRAGAGSVAEAWANRVPTVFLPYPYHKDQHQRLNALPLAERNASVLVADHIDPACNLADAGGRLLGLIEQPADRRAMSAALAALGPANGAEQVARALFALSCA